MKDYARYRWFYTSKNTLVVGGKNAAQNDELLTHMLAMKQSYYVLHTSAPGSPFSAIIKERGKVSNEELKETAIFTACFSQAWKTRAKKTSVDIFTCEQLSKPKGAKIGMWHVKGKVKKIEVALKLVLTKQKGVLRAVPLQSATRVLARISPGNLDKQVAVAQCEVILDNNVGHDELMAALPAGNMAVSK